MGLEISVRKGEVTIRKRGLRGTGLSAKRESWEGLHYWLISLGEGGQKDYCAIDLTARRDGERVYIEDKKGNNFKVKQESISQLVDITGFVTEDSVVDDNVDEELPVHIEVNPADYKGIACASPKYLQVITCPFCDNTFEVGNE